MKRSQTATDSRNRAVTLDQPIVSADSQKGPRASLLQHAVALAIPLAATACGNVDKSSAISTSQALESQSAAALADQASGDPRLRVSPPYMVDRLGEMRWATISVA